MQQLFSYGTLQQERVQIETFGRKLVGNPDSLLGFKQTMIEIKDQGVIAKSGKTHHPIIQFTGNPEDKITGTVFEITDEELESADRYEVKDYKRVSAPLASGGTAWVYVAAI